MATKVTSKSKQATSAPAAKAEVETTQVYLAVGRSFTHQGFKFLPNVAYEVEDVVADFLLQFKAGIDQNTFEEVGKRQKELPVQVVKFKGAGPVASAAVEIGGDLDAELMEHLESGQHSGEPGDGEGKTGEGEGSEGEGGEGEGIVTV